MRQRELIEVMSVQEMIDWLAYDMLQDDESRKKIQYKIDMEKQSTNTASEEASLVRNLFMCMGMKKK